VAPSASEKEIAKAYRSLAARYHPDKHQGNELEDLAKEKLVALNEAYRVLSDRRLRASWDADRRAAAVKRPPPPRDHSGHGGAPVSESPARGTARTAGQIAAILLLLAATPILLRVIRSPQIAVIIGIAILLAWFGPRIVGWLRRRR